jgi:hypothetical protein
MLYRRENEIRRMVRERLLTDSIDGTDRSQPRQNSSRWSRFSQRALQSASSRYLVLSSVDGDLMIEEEVTLEHIQEEGDSAHNSLQQGTEVSSDILKQMYKTEARMLPVNDFMLIMAIYVLVFLVSMVKDSAYWDSILGISKCSGGYFLLIFVFSVVLVVITVLVANMLVKRTNLKKELGYDWDENDMLWSYKKVVVICLVSAAAGSGASILGIGGGSVIGPMMLAFKIRPEQTAATSSFILLFTSSISIVQFISNGMVDMPYGGILLLVSFVGSTTGVLVIKNLVDKYQRASIIVLAVAGILILSTVVIPIYGIYSTVTAILKGTGEFAFRSMCTES